MWMMVALDSLAVLASLKSGWGITCLVSEIAQEAEGRHSFVYILAGHQGHEENEKADHLEKKKKQRRLWDGNGDGCTEGLEEGACEAKVEGLGMGVEISSEAWARAGHGKGVYLQFAPMLQDIREAVWKGMSLGVIECFSYCRGNGNCGKGKTEDAPLPTM